MSQNIQFTLLLSLCGWSAFQAENQSLKFPIVVQFIFTVSSLLGRFGEFKSQQLILLHPEASEHSEPEGNIGIKNCLAWNIPQTYDFCMALDFLDTKDLKKT